MLTLNQFLIEQVFSKSDERYARFAMYRQKDVFGFGEDSMTFKEIAALEGISKSRAAQICFKAKLKISRRLHQIAEAQKTPHVIIKKVTDETTVANLPMRLKFVYELEEESLSVRTWNCLRYANLMTIDNLIEKTEHQLLRLPNFGRKSLNEIKQLLSRHGLELKLSEKYQL